MLMLICPESLPISAIAKAQLDRLDLTYTHSETSPFTNCTHFPCLQVVKHNKLKKQLHGKHTDKTVLDFLEIS